MKDNYYLLLDTDIGKDLDDLLALAYLLTEKRIILKGITVVGNDLDKRAKLVNILCKIANKEIPIYKGKESVLPNDWYVTPIDDSKISLWPHNDYYEGNYIDFMYSVIKENPYAITIVSIGPLTNLSELFKIYPNCSQYIKELRIVGGVFNEELNNSPEMPFINYNFWSDPDSAKRVLKSNVQSIKVYGYEITKDLFIFKDELIKKSNTNILKCVLNLGYKWLNIDKPNLEDALVGVSLIDDTICTYKKGNILIDTETNKESTTYAKTKFIPNETSNIEIATSVNKEKFINLFFQNTSNPIISRNIFMCCNKLNTEALININDNYTIRTLREDELNIWKRLLFNSEKEYLNNKDFIDNYFNDNYLVNKELFFKKCILVCNNDVPIATCLIWNKFNKYTTINHLKVTKEYENQNIEKELLSYVLKGIKDEDFPLFILLDPEDTNNIKSLSDLGFSFIIKPDIIENNSNDFYKCINDIKSKFSEETFKRFTTIDLSNYK